MHVCSASPALGPDQVAMVENTQHRDLETLEGGHPVPPGLLPGSRILGRKTCLMLAFKGHLSALRTDYKNRPTKGQ